MAVNAWLGQLTKYSEKYPVSVIRFGRDEWTTLEDSRKGLSEFTFARSHGAVEKVKKNTVCILSAYNDEGQVIRIGLVQSKSAITTLDTRIKISRVSKISVKSEIKLQELITTRPFSGNLSRRLKKRDSVIGFSSKLSGHLLKELGQYPENLAPLQRIFAALNKPKLYKTKMALQLDAVRTAMKAFGLGTDDFAASFELLGDKQTALASVKILEDSVIEHDARVLPDYKLIESYATGHAIFEKRGQRLDIFTANKRDLEKALGVDLIYVNLAKNNIVMLQYKILKPESKKGQVTDWIYRPDKQLTKEVKRMKKFSKKQLPSVSEFRLNSDIFYMKFVKKNGLISNGGIIMPLDHFTKVQSDPESIGTKGGVRVSYETLNGRYMRSTPFIDLISSGYIGSYAETTKHLVKLIEAIIQDGKSVVAAIQTNS